MTEIHYQNNVWAYVTADAPELERLLRYRPPGYQFSPAYKRWRDYMRANPNSSWAPGWDGYIRLTRQHSAGKRFPAGLVPYVLRQFPTWKVGPKPERPAPGGLFSATPLVELGEHQEEAVSAACETERGIVQYPTGTGKGRIIGELIRRLGLPTLVIVDKKDLLAQLSREVEQATGFKVGRVGGGQHNFQVITVGTFQSLAKHVEELDRFAVVIVDEAHHAAAATLEKVLQSVPAYYRFGFSATPFKAYAGKKTDRGTFLRVQAWLGPPIAQLSIEEAIETGRIIRPDIYWIKGCRWEGEAINYKDEYQLGIVENEERNLVICRLARQLRQQGPTVILVQRQDHGQLLANTLGVNFVYGNTPANTRQDIYTRFKQGDVDCLVIGKIGDEALDLPNIEHLIMAGGGAAPHVQVQRIGRGMRAANGKQNVYVFDFEDYGKHISRHAAKRHAAYLAEAAYNVIEMQAQELFT